MKNRNIDLPATVIVGLLLLMLAEVNAWAMLAASACGAVALFATCKRTELRRGLLVLLVACMIAAAAVALLVWRFR